MRLSNFLEAFALETDIVIADADRGGVLIFEGTAGDVPQRVMLDFISKDVQDYIMQNDIQFTDWEKASLIHHSGLPVEERHSRLERLANSADDKTLRGQIAERLAMEREELAVFYERDKGYVYAVWSYKDKNKPHICGYFAGAELAYAHGLKQKCKFEIEKSRIIGVDGTQSEIKANKGYLKPYMSYFDNLNENRLVQEQKEYAEAVLTYDPKGVLTYYWSGEIERSVQEEMELTFSSQRFENALFVSRIPNPFNRGDIVRNIRTGEHGTVECSQEKWEYFLARVKAGAHVNFSDASIIVEFITENGSAKQDCISPIFLEYYEPEKKDDDH